MIISGLQKLTLLDYPGKVACILFTQGCNFACGYCHNAEMIPIIQDPQTQYSEKNLFEFLRSRQGLLDGVVITGGEPTLHEDLGEFIRKIRSMGFFIKLDSNGSNPIVLEKFLAEGLLDYIAMDIKATAEKYQKLVKNDCSKGIFQSIKVIMTSGIDYEFRSTIMPSVHSVEDIHKMGRMIQGAKRWYLQNFRGGKTLSRTFQHQRSFTQKELENFKEIAEEYVEQVEVRNGVLTEDHQ